MPKLRKKPWKRIKTAYGIKYDYDFQDLNWGIKRTRRTFNSVEECETYHEILLKNAMNIQKGEKPERSFGEAIIEYMEQIENDGKLSQVTDKIDLMTLRWPFQYQGKWYRLEELSLDDSEGGIIWGIKKYKLDLSNVIRRSYINRKLYHLRREGKALRWYEQPSPAEDMRPKSRQSISDEYTLKRLNKAKGRGAFSSDTLRRRFSIAKTILHTAWHDWRWIDIDLGALIKLDEPGKARISFLTATQFEKLISVSDEYFAYLIRGGKSIGWRKSNLVGLTWDRVIFSRYMTNEDGQRIKVPGYLKVNSFDKSHHLFDPADLTQRRTRTKNKDDLETIMTDEIENLLREMEQKRHSESDVVFHDGSGAYWGDFRKRWITAKKRADVPADFRWHDLRHTWATDRINEGVPKHIIMEEQGWKDPEMVDRYAHLQREARYAALQKAKN